MSDPRIAEIRRALEVAAQFEADQSDSLHGYEAMRALVSVEADLAETKSLLAAKDRDGSMADLGVALQALRKIAMKPKRFHPVAGYQFDVDVASIAAAALAQIVIAHRCAPPMMPSGLTAPLQPDWTCGVCGRLWRDWNGGGSSPVRWWAEIRGAAGAEE